VSVELVVVRLQYILLFLNSVNRDQEEALMQMKFHRAGANKPIIETIDIARGIRLLTQIKLDTASKLFKITFFVTFYIYCLQTHLIPYILKTSLHMRGFLMRILISLANNTTEVYYCLIITLFLLHGW